MPAYRRHRAWIARIVCCTLLLALFVPALRQAGAVPAPWLDVCSAAGARAAPQDGAPAASKKAHGQHCLACYVQHAAILPDPVQLRATPAAPVMHVIRATASVLAAAPRAGAAWPRAPPPRVF